MKTVRTLLMHKSAAVWSISPDASADEALHAMAEHDISALVVLDAGRVCGIVTERDFARKLAVAGRSPAATSVRDIMSERVLYIRPEQTVEECMALMTERHLRHLPVIEDGTLIGMVSMRDVVADVISEKSFVIEQLENYLFELPPDRSASR